MNKTDIVEMIITVSVIAGLIGLMIYTGRKTRKGSAITVKETIIKYIIIETAMILLLAANIRRLKKSENAIDWISAGIYLTAAAAAVIKKYSLIFRNLKKE